MLNEEAEESLRGDFDDSDFEVEELEEKNTDFEKNNQIYTKLNLILTQEAFNLNLTYYR